jgi:cysteine synthase
MKLTKKGILKAGDVLIEPTSGNTGTKITVHKY